MPERSTMIGARHADHLPLLCNKLNIWFTEYPAMVGLALGVIVTNVVMIGIGTQVRRAGMALKPLVWFVVLLAMVAGPQATVRIVHQARDLGARGALPHVGSCRTGAQHIRCVLSARQRHRQYLSWMDRAALWRTG
jgi:hypothetical protein